MLLAQEHRIEILCAVAERGGRGHKDYGVEIEAPMPPDRGKLAGAARDLALALLPGRTFGHGAPDIQHQQCWNRGDNEHPAPAERAEADAGKQCGQKLTERITRVQDARHEAAPVRRYAFHRQARADTPFAAHGDAV
jgi:hypothetical protein